MKKLYCTFILVIALWSQGLLAQSRNRIDEYIAKYKDIAMAEMARTGVPASITLAQGIHESGAGTSDLVQRSNNHFGIKCKTEWTGEKVYHDDDARGECFRKYDDPFTSYKDHSDFLRTRKHYASLFELDPEDYEGWAHGLKKAGYATNPKYPQILIKLIRDYNLQDYSLIVLGKKQPGETEPAWVKLNAPVKEEEVVLTKSSEASNAAKRLYPQGVFTINDTKVVAVAKGTSYLKVAEDNDISLARLLEFNDLKDGDVTTEDGLLFLQRKRKTGANEFHVVTEGETLYSIAQAQGIRLESLLEYNQLTANATVAAGEKLYLKSQAPARPKLAGLFGWIKNKEQQPAEPVAPKEEHSAPQLIVHVVQPKDTVYSIARKYEVGVDDVKKWNEMQSTDLKIGQQLKINKSR
ncbi:MAG TPA: glucosaminidase domain-containing protein [Flavisolibacter sp.]|jgi:LysM repeat protein|nr:glucosaminidase domain-containing protein [Flavisolibacter sp.]